LHFDKEVVSLRMSSPVSFCAEKDEKSAACPCF
jgi:hypothetical protein